MAQAKRRSQAELRDNFLHLVGNILYYAIFILLMLPSVWMMLALITQNALDPSWVQSRTATDDATIHNWMGLSGAYFADISRYFLGRTVWLLPLGLLTYLLTLFIGRLWRDLDIEIVLMRSVGAFASLLLIATLVDLTTQSGGVLGNFIGSQFILKIFSLFNAETSSDLPNLLSKICVSILLMGSLIMATGLMPWQWFDKLGAGIFWVIHFFGQLKNKNSPNLEDQSSADYSERLSGLEHLMQESSKTEEDVHPANNISAVDVDINTIQAMEAKHSNSANTDKKAFHLLSQIIKKQPSSDSSIEPADHFNGIDNTEADSDLERNLQSILKARSSDPQTKILNHQYQTPFSSDDEINDEPDFSKLIQPTSNNLHSTNFSSSTNPLSEAVQVLHELDQETNPVSNPISIEEENHTINIQDQYASFQAQRLDDVDETIIADFAISNDPSEEAEITLLNDSSITAAVINNEETQANHKNYFDEYKNQFHNQIDTQAMHLEAEMPALTPTDPPKESASEPLDQLKAISDYPNLASYFKEKSNHIDQNTEQPEEIMAFGKAALPPVPQETILGFGSAPTHTYEITPQVIDSDIPFGSLQGSYVNREPKDNHEETLPLKDEPSFDANLGENNQQVHLHQEASPSIAEDSTLVSPPQRKVMGFDIDPRSGAPKPIMSAKTFPYQGQLPPDHLLNNPPPYVPAYNQEQLQQMAVLVETQLKHFNIEVRVAEIDPGPVITRFELDLAPGVKVAQINNLAKDIARGLSVTSVRVVEIIPGKPYVGLEIPNLKREIVYFKTGLQSEEYMQAAHPMTLILGKDTSGRTIIANLAKMPHLLVAGTTGSGKSVGVNTMLLSLLFKSRPDQVRMILIDPKMLELSVYNDIPHLLTPVVTDMKEAANSLRWCVAEMERRYLLMSQLKVRNIEGFNKIVNQSIADGNLIPDPLWQRGEHVSDEVQHPTLKPLPFIVVVVDEFADMMMLVGKKVEELIARLAQKARACGIHLILATQRPSVDVITGLIKANIPTRIAFQVSSKIDSRTIIDQQGAETLLGHGDMLYLPPGTGIPIRVHGAFVDDHEVNKVVEFLKLTGDTDFIDDILQDPTEPIPGLSPEASGNPTENTDVLYDEAVNIVLESKRASISFVQRKLRIGYQRAARLIEEMEEAGIISAPQHNGNREILVPTRDN